MDNIGAAATTTNQAPATPNPEPQAPAAPTSPSNTAPTTEPGAQQTPAPEPEKTFTQAELTAVAAQEKRQGKQSVMKLFGIADEKDLKSAAEQFKQWSDSQKTAEAKLKEQQELVAAAERKAAEAEAKVLCMGAGVGADSVNDVLAIAQTRVTEEKGLPAVLEEMKKDQRYAGFFGAATPSAGGTGSPGGHANGSGSANGAVENIGARLGKARAQAPAQSNYFKN